jgi:mannose-6-phosphate isomerase-like protein (cupin superfamily)
MRFLLLLVCASAFAAGPVSVQIWSSADIKKTAEGLSAATEKSGYEGKSLGGYGNHSTAVWLRSRSGQAELHKAKVDLLIIEEGSATLIYGGTIPDGRSTSAVEIRGSKIVGGESRPLNPGDVVRVPAGVPHQFVLAKGQAVSYFAIKIAR